MKISKLFVGAFCLSIAIFFTGCNSQRASSSAGPEISSGSASLLVLQSSSSKSNSKDVILYTYKGMAPSPTEYTLTQQVPPDAQEVQETVRMSSDEATPEKIMKLYTEKYLSKPVGNGTMNFSYSSASMNRDGIITIDFTKEGANYLSYGSMLELNSLYGIGKTMLMNVEGAKAVCYGIEGGNYSTEMFLNRSTPYLTK
ncbi:hypothetical protein [Caproiciproducens galactitolivorans]|uniref:GerMN domain-containing protein n=1 Tax=Caproiciproducens galactitolivorans TaxID=642589 RepID=A0ABT4BRL7_9FIRM|nr:hypothetical protein [Caproiciproducens galactitolivorans]MCY1713532.1 hypothetical protein [Caproiciproducens galactitolivorans]